LFKSLLKNNMGIVLSIAACVLIGICTGAFAINNLSSVQTEDLTNYMGGFSEIYSNQSVSTGSLFVLSIGQNIKYFLILLVSGMTIIGLPAIYFMCWARSFITGFSIGVIIGAFGSKGILIAFLTIVPTDFFKLSAFMYLGINAVIFSVRIFKLLARKGFDISFKNSFVNFMKSALFSLFFLFAGILYETLLTPVLFRLLV